MSYVDNFFDLSLPDVCAARKAKLEAVFAEAGIALHEKYQGKWFPGLGWEWDITAMTMTCPVDKHIAFNGYLRRWRDASTMTLFDVERAVGLMSWASAGLPVLTAGVAPLIHMRSALKRLAKVSKSSAPVQSKLSPEARVAINFTQSVYSKWNRVAPITQGFDATVMWDSLGRCDASPDGCGGILVDGSSLLAFMHVWTPSEKERAMVVECKSTTILELMGAVYWANAFGTKLNGLRVQLEMDCEPAVIDIQKAFSAKQSVLDCVSEFRLSCARSNFHLRTRHVLGEVFNKIADSLSRGRLDQACREAKEEFGRDLTLVQD